MNLKHLLLYNIQSHVKTVLEFMETGVHRIQGDNSKGKSVIMKALNVVLFGESLNGKERDALIRDGCQRGAIQVTNYEGKSLMCILDREASKTYFEFSYQDKKIRKYLSDNYKDLIKLFNFHYDEDLKFSIHRYITKTTLPYTRTPGSLNYKILDSVSEIPELSKAINKLDELIPKVKVDLDQVSNRLQSLESVKKGIHIIPVDRMKMELTYLQNTYRTHQKIEEFINSITKLEEINLEKEQVKYIDIKNVDLTVVENFQKLNNIADTMKLYKEIQRDFKVEKPNRDELHQLLRLLSISKITETLMELRRTKVNVEESKISTDTKEKFQTLTNLNVAIGLINSLIESFKTREELQKVKIPNLKTMKSLVDMLGEIKEYLATKEEINKCKQVDKIPNYEDLDNLYKSVKGLGKLEDKLKEIQVLKKNCQRIEKQLNNLKEEIGYCEACGRLFDEIKHYKTS